LVVTAPDVVDVVLQCRVGVVPSGVVVQVWNQVPSLGPLQACCGLVCHERARTVLDTEPGKVHRYFAGAGWFGLLWRFTSMERSVWAPVWDCE